jgi:hypothetical protein
MLKGNAMKVVMNVVLSVAIMVLFAMPALAQEELYGPQKGDGSFTPQLSYQHMYNGVSSDLIFGFLSLGYYFTGQFEIVVGISVGVMLAEVDNIMFGGGPSLVYHFHYRDTQRVSPFLGVGAAMNYNEMSGEGVDYSSTDPSAAVFGGLDFWLTERTSFRFTLRNDTTFSDGDTQNVFGIVLGANFLFGK